jgi:nucleotide-binding universal stress UspA family protein
MVVRHSKTKPVRIRLILFASDFSTASETARGYTAYLAQRLGTEVRVLHVIEPIEPQEEMDPELEDWYERLKKDLKQKLDQDVRFFTRRKVKASGEMLLGSRWKAIIRVAEEEGAELVVVGSHGIIGPGGQPRLGTTSHRVVLASSVPVLITR